MKPNRPVCIDASHCSGSVTSPSESGNLPISAFRRAVYGDTLEDFVGRNTYRADGTQAVDAGVYKSFRIYGATSLMVRLDCFNVFNWARWWYPGNDFASPSTFGKVTQTAYITTASPSTAPAALSPPRTWQLGFRFIY
jgi:hypothetical protein